MMMNVEVALFERGYGGIQIEHKLLVTQAGFEFMTTEPRELTALG